MAFVASHRLAALGDRGFARIAPDLAIEVLSPDDRPGEVMQKVGDWLRAGTRLVWLVDPETRAGQVYRANETTVLLSECDAFDGEDVLPGFHCPLTDVL